MAYCRHARRTAHAGIRRRLPAQKIAKSAIGFLGRPNWEGGKSRARFLKQLLIIIWGAVAPFPPENIFSGFFLYYTVLHCTTTTTLYYTVLLCTCEFQLFVGETLEAGSCLSILISRKENKMRRHTHFLVMSEGFWEHSHQRRSPY